MVQFDIVISNWNKEQGDTKMSYVKNKIKNYLVDISENGFCMRQPIMNECKQNVSKFKPNTAVQ